MQEIEVRSYGNVNLAESESRTIEGYFITFNQRSALLYDQKQDMFFYEIIKPEAVTRELIDSSDIYACWQHEQDKVFARWNKGKGSLELELDDIGLHFRFEAPHTYLGDQLVEFLKRGDVDQCSFGFVALPEDYEYSRTEDGHMLRTIHNIRYIKEGSIVFNAAYPSSTVDLRSYNEFAERERADITSKLVSMLDELDEIDINK